MATKRSKTVEVPAQAVTTSIKGFNADLSCTPDGVKFQYEIGKTYELTDDIKVCNVGFHACPVEHHPLSVFEFYAPAGNRFCEVQQGRSLPERIAS